VAHSDMWAEVRDTRRVVGLSGRGHGRRRGRDGAARGEAVGDAIGRRWLLGRTHARGPDSAFKAQRGVGAWQPGGDGALTGGPLMPACQRFPNLKFTPG
jgi:hypothetical protein